MAFEEIQGVARDVGNFILNVLDAIPAPGGGAAGFPEIVPPLQELGIVPGAGFTPEEVLAFAVDAGERFARDKIVVFFTGIPDIPVVTSAVIDRAEAAISSAREGAGQAAYNVVVLLAGPQGGASGSVALIIPLGPAGLSLPAYVPGDNFWARDP